MRYNKWDMKLFLTSSNNFITPDLVKHLDRSPAEMRLTFIPTAAEVEKGDLQWLNDDRQALVGAGLKVQDFTLTGKTKAQVKAMLAETDFVFVSGGNTFYLLQEMRKSGFSELIRPYLEKGGYYGGSSAGSVVAGPDISLFEALDDPSLAPELEDHRGLNLVDVVLFVHWGSDHFAKRYQELLKNGYRPGQKVVLLTDDQYLFCEHSRYTIESA